MKSMGIFLQFFKSFRGKIYKKHSTGNEEWIESQTALITIDYVLHNSGGSRPSDKGVFKKIFSAFQASVWSKNKGEGSPALDPPLHSHLSIS